MCSRIEALGHVPQEILVGPEPSRVHFFLAERLGGAKEIEVRDEKLVHIHALSIVLLSWLGVKALTNPLLFTSK